MGRESEEREIDGLTFVSHQMEPLELYPLAPRIVKIVAPMLPHLQAMAGSIGEGLTGDMLEKLLRQDVGKLSPMLMALGEALAAKETASLPMDLLKRSPIQMTKTRSPRRARSPRARRSTRCFVVASSPC
jgi:hypothetical protein